MRKYFILFFFLAFLVSPVFADGMAFKSVEDRWALRPETMQVAAITYEDGYENLLLTVSLENTLLDNTTVWIFPVPAQPDQIEIDLVNGYPRFGGKNLDRLAGDTVGSVALCSAGYGAFPASLPLAMMGGAGFFTLQKAQATAMDDMGGLVVHERIERMGMVTELVTARDGSTVRDYITENGLLLPPEAESILDDYTGRDYSLVISYAGNSTGTVSQSGPDIMSVFVRFPAERIYFPLRPTSIYGDRVIPVVIDVTGFVTPLPGTDIRPATEVSYYIDDQFWPSYSADELGTFFNDPIPSGPVKYTRVRIDSPSESFTSDLFMDPAPPADVQAKEALISFSVFWAVPLYIIVSMAASLAAGTLVFGRNPAHRRILALHGLWNCATMIGFACGTAEYLRIAVATRRQKTGYFILFYILFIGFFSLLAAIASPAMAHGLANIYSFLFILPVIGFLFGMHIFATNPPLAILLFIVNAAIWGLAWLAGRTYLK